MAMIYHEYGHSETRSFDFSKIWLLCFLDIVLPVSLVPLFVSPLVFSWPLPSLFSFSFHHRWCRLFVSSSHIGERHVESGTRWKQCEQFNVLRLDSMELSVFGAWSYKKSAVSWRKKKCVHINDYWEHHPNDVRSATPSSHNERRIAGVSPPGNAGRDRYDALTLAALYHLLLTPGQLDCCCTGVCISTVA